MPREDEEAGGGCAAVSGAREGGEGRADGDGVAGGSVGEGGTRDEGDR